jgi:CRISPR-associated protein Csb2
MIAFTIKFIAGRYHATPWGRHVNEADVEWPPSPWRILRAFIATWHRKLDPDRYPEKMLSYLVEQLSAELPLYDLPPATHAHTRHYMPVRDKPVLIFDAFSRVDADNKMLVAWPETKLNPETIQLLDKLLENTGFLGRAESWVEMERLKHWNGKANCRPCQPGTDTPKGLQPEPVTLTAPLSAPQYSSWRKQTLENIDWKTIKPKKKAIQLKSTLPEHLIDALRLETGDIQAAGWSRPPGAEPVLYHRPADAFRVNRQTTVRIFPKPLIDNVRLAMAGKPLPLLEDSVKLGELLRVAVISRAKIIYGAENIPVVFSGHQKARNSGHVHVFYLPEDADDDGRIDHLVVHAKMGLAQTDLIVLDSLRKLFTRDGQEWQVILENHGTSETMAESSMMLSSGCTWVSSTPYLHPWHKKKNLDVSDQIYRECKERHLPDIQNLRQVETIKIHGRERRPVHFHRFRAKRGLTQPDRQGSFWQIVFAEPVQGPLALGFGCHFGLGIFKCEEN